MPNFTQFSGVYAAAVTPLNLDHSLALDDIPFLLEFLARRGCHGVLLLGTTGEGPSFAPDERIELLRAAQRARQSIPKLRLLAGTGTPSLEETCFLTRAAFDAGMDGVVILPPYYYRKVTDDGLFAYFSRVLQQAVPAGGMVLGYHIPPVTGIGFSPDLLARLLEAFPDKFAGIKDSSGDAEYARLIGERFGKDFFVLTGNDRLFSHALHNQAAGCITAMANLESPLLRQVWDAHQNGETALEAQNRLTQARGILDQHPPMPPILKALLAHMHGFPRWTVRPPLLPLEDQIVQSVATALSSRMD
jgi:4-hydroxy-tetrahydrodipicolinate synthase